MKTADFYSVVLALLLLGSCSSDESISPEEDILPVTPCNSAGPPEFLSTPVGFYGRSSINIQVKTNIPATIYYVVSDMEISEKSPINVKQAALDGDNFISANFLTVHCDDIDSIMSIAVKDLPEETQLYAYVVAESYSQDTVLQEQVSSIEFTTKKRIEIESFSSSVKGRNALYVSYVPDEEGYIYPQKELHPLIIFLGGNGEVAPPGEINLIQNGSIPKYLSEGNDIPFIVVAPEHTEEEWDVNFIHEVTEYAVEHYAVDPDKIIITGMSGGGIGTFAYAIAHPDIPAAIVPISGEGETEKACDLSNMAVWAFHNLEDPKVPSSGSVDMINAIKACDPAPTEEVNLTIFADEGHNGWIRVYNPLSNMWELDPTVAPINIYDWMLKQSK